MNENTLTPEERAALLTELAEWLAGEINNMVRGRDYGWPVWDFLYHLSERLNLPEDDTAAFRDLESRTLDALRTLTFKVVADDTEGR